MASTLFCCGRFFGAVRFAELARPIMSPAAPASTSALALLQSAFPGQIWLDSKQVGQACNITPASIRTLRARGKFKVPSISNGGKHLFDIRDVAAYLDAQRTPKPKRGARSKAERLAIVEGSTL